LANRRFRLVARVSSSSPGAIEPVLRQLLPAGSVKEVDGEFLVDAEMQGGNAKELNRVILSALRRAEKRTRLRAQWTSEDGVTESFFDYVLKKTTRG